MKQGCLIRCERIALSPASVAFVFLLAALVIQGLSAPPAEAAATCTFGSGWTATSGVEETFQFDPSVVSTTTTEDVALKVKVVASIDRIVLELARGTTVTLTSYGSGLFCTILSTSDVLYDYDASDVNHNFVGFLSLYTGTTRVARINAFINVADANVPEVTVEPLGPNVQSSPRVFNLLLADVSPDTIGSNLMQVAQQFYARYPDSFDFLMVVSEPEQTVNRHYIAIRNSIQGIGSSVFDNSSFYGSAGRLMGIVRYPIGTFFDLAEAATHHELGHHFANWLSVPALQGVQVHWPISSLGGGLLQVADQSGQGVNFPYSLTPLGGSNYRLDPATPSTTFNDMELYLMGLIPASQVGEHFVFVNQSQTLCGGCTLTGPTATLQIADVLAQHGPRVPAYPTARRIFRLATIVVSMDRLLTAREMAFYDHMAARGEAMEPLEATWGFARGITSPFHVATGRRGYYVTSLDVTSSPGFHTLAPCRVVDTRQTTGAYGGPALLASQPRSFALAGKCSIPTSAKALSANFTVTAATSGGFLSVYAGTTVPLASTLNYGAGQTRANNAIVLLDQGLLNITAGQASGSAHVIVDVNGYFE